LKIEYEVIEMKMDEVAAKIESSCKLYREIVQLIPVIRSVVSRFDGKVYTKRFVNAVNAEAEKRFGKELYITSDFSVSKTRLFIYGHKRGAYSVQPAMCYLELSDEKRIDAAQVLKSCNEEYSKILQECAAKEAGILEMPQIIARLDELHKLQEALLKKVPNNLYYEYDIKHVLEYGAAWVFPELKKPS
jgi:hypothetical protein